MSWGGMRQAMTTADVGAAMADNQSATDGGAGVADGVLRQEFMATLSRLDKIDARMDALLTSSQGQQLALADLRGVMMSRAETEAALDKRVSLELFTATMTAASQQRERDIVAIEKQREEDNRGIEQRLTKLEGAPQRTLSWVALGVSLIGVAVTLVYFAGYLAQHYR